MQQCRVSLYKMCNKIVKFFLSSEFLFNTYCKTITKISAKIKMGADAEKRNPYATYFRM